MHFCKNYGKDLIIDEKVIVLNGSDKMRNYFKLITLSFFKTVTFVMFWNYLINFSVESTFLENKTASIWRLTPFNVVNKFIVKKCCIKAWRGDLTCKMSPKANGPTVLPAVDTRQHQGLFARLTSCFRKQNVGANGRVMPSHTVSRYYFISWISLDLSKYIVNESIYWNH